MVWECQSWIDRSHVGRVDPTLTQLLNGGGEVPGEVIGPEAVHRDQQQRRSTEISLYTCHIHVFQNNYRYNLYLFIKL